MTYTAEDLYELLPAIYRIRDADQGLVLRGLLEVLAGQADALDRDIAGLYDNWFIETCAPWVVPYIGDLMRVRGLIPTGRAPAGTLSVLGTAFSQRAHVANTIRFRRRKGTPAVLEELAYAVAGWRARVVEFFQLLSTTQYLNHLRPFNVRTPDLRRTDVLELEGGQFDTMTHTVEVRPVDPPFARDGRRTPIDRGRYDIPNLGLYVWRLQTFSVTRGTPRLVTTPADAGYTFSPLGLDGPLFNPPQTEPDITHLAQEVNVPGPLRRRALSDELEARRQALVDDPDADPAPGFLVGGSPAFRVFLKTPAKASPEVVPPEEILACDLSVWGRPAATRSYTPSSGGLDQDRTITAAVDPVLGRLTFATDVTPERVQVSFGYGSSGNVGGGPYDLRDGLALWFDPNEVTWARGVLEDAPTGDPFLVPDLRTAVAAWNAFVATQARATGVIAVMDSATYAGDLTGAIFGIVIPAQCRLAIVAASRLPLAGFPPRTPDRAEFPRPHVDGAISVRGSATGSDPPPGELILQGLLVEGVVSVLAGNLGHLRVIDCTLVPASGGLVVNPSVQKGQQNSGLGIDLDRTICGPISLPGAVHQLRVHAGIVDAGSGAAVTAPGADADIQQTTVFGTSHVRTATAGNSIFTGPLTADLLQEGCVRFSSLAAGSTTPRRFRCQPDLALKGVTDPAVAARVEAEMIPAFTSTRYGDPAYGQLALTCALGIRTGAEDGSEMGVFSSLQQPQREANLRASLDEYLRFGLEAGVFFVT